MYDFGPEESERIRKIAVRDRQDLAADLAVRPDVILVEDAVVRRKYLATQELAHALDGYRQVATVQDAEIWLRDASLAAR